MGKHQFEGGCYCGQLRYSAVCAPLLKAQCHCRACQYFSGGAQNVFMLVPTKSFTWIMGAPQRFALSNIANPVTREFCSQCGTHLTSRRPGLDAVILKVGTLDDPKLFGIPSMAVFTVEKQAFHYIPKDLRTFVGLPAQ